VNIAIFGIKAEISSRLSLNRVTNGFDTTGKTFKYSIYVSSHFHRNNSKLIFFIHPDQERFCCIVENTTTLWPVTLHAGNLKVGVTRHEKEVVINKLLTDLFIHTSQRIIFAREISRKCLKGCLHEVLNAHTLLTGDTRRETKSINGSAYTNSDGVYWYIRDNISLDLLDIHVRCVSVIGADTVILLDDGVEHLSKVPVTVPITSIDTTVLVVKHSSTGNGLLQGEAGGGSFDATKFLETSFSYMFGYETVFGLDLHEEGEYSVLLL